MVRKKRSKGYRILVDTSVVVAGIGSMKKPPIEPYNASQMVLRICTEKPFTWLVSDEILEEYKGVMKVVKIHSHVAGLLINKVKEKGELIYPKAEANLSPDPFDDMFYSCALAGDADMIVTLNLKDFPQVGKRPKIMSPQEFVAKFGDK